MEDLDAMDVKEVAKLLKRSVSWTYAHAEELGAVKIGGAVIFNRRALEEVFEDATSRAKERQKDRQVARSRDGGQAAKDKAVSHKKGRKKVGSRKKGGVEIWGADTDPGRHGINNFLQSLLGLCGAEVFNENLHREEGLGSKSLR